MEKLKFKITLEATWWGEAKDSPVCSIHVTNGEHYVSQVFDGKERTVVFEEECGEDNTLNITFVNKSPDDVVLDSDGNILKDKLLHIKKIEIDDIDITNVARFQSEYDAGEFGIHRNHMDLGWNGTWKLDFSTPFYIWLLENM